MLAACGSPNSKAGPTIVVAASLQESLHAVADQWTAEGHKPPVLAFAASSALARQIENGAPADLFMSADEAWMDALDVKHLLRPDTRADLLGNQLVLIAPKKSLATVSFDNPSSLVRALGDGRLGIANPDSVPAGRYAKAALEHLHLWSNLKDRLAGAENVRAALALVESGEAPLGIVYATDAKASAKVRIVTAFPAESHPAILYPVAILASSKHPDAKAFRDFLASEKAQAIFARYGFRSLR